MIRIFYYIFAVVYTFNFWGVGYGVIGLILPIFPLIDLATLLMEYA